MKNEYLVLEGDIIAERVIGDSEKLKMFYSDNEVWHQQYRGTKKATLVDNGNGIKINLEGKKIKLEYDDFCDLVNLIKIKMFEDDRMSATTEIIKIEE